MRAEADIHRQLASQGRRRPLTPEEDALAAALEQIFASGAHDFAAVANHLNERGIGRPSGAPQRWNEASLLQELDRINRSLDDAYEAAPPVAPYR